MFIRLFEENGLVAIVDPSSRVAKFTESEFVARYLRRGKGEPELKKFLPPKTHLIIVPKMSYRHQLTSIGRHWR